MNATVQVLREDDCAQVHERSLKLLQDTGVRVMSGRARSVLDGAGAEVKNHYDRVYFPRAIIENAMKLAPVEFTLGTRRPDRDLAMNSGECRLCADGGAVSVLDWDTQDLRPGTFDDWLAATKLIDSLDEIDIYWNMVEGGCSDTRAGYVEYWIHLLGNCSKHIQDSVSSMERARLLLEILEIAFGSRDHVRLKRPFSHVLCPTSPLMLDSQYTDAFLETASWGLPVAIMPMPLMGATSPASLISTVLVANADFLASLCLVQAASPGTAILYAAMPSVVEPHTWRYTGGGIENSLLSVAAAEMGRYYRLPVEIGAGGTDHFLPGIQSSYERAINWVLPSAAWPDILVGPGLLGGSTILSFEQMMIDVEIFRRCRRLRTGISTASEHWLEDILKKQGPGGNFIGQKSTMEALHDGRLYLSRFGFHEPFEKWKSAGKPDLINEIREIMQETLRSHKPLPLDPAVQKELEALALRMRKTDA